MPSVLRIDYDTLNRLAKRLDKLQETFNGLKGSMDRLKGAAEYNDLESAIHDFEDSWNYNRRSLTNDLVILSESAKGIVDNFTETDLKIADAAWEGIEGMNG